MPVKIAFFKTGEVVCSSVEESEDEIGLENPVALVPQAAEVRFIPLLFFTAENRVSIKRDDLKFGRLFEPNTEILNNYVRLFGGGIMRATEFGAVNVRQQQQ